jgi:hypothetical protein
VFRILRLTVLVDEKGQEVEPAAASERDRAVDVQIVERARDGNDLRDVGFVDGEAADADVEVPSGTVWPPVLPTTYEGTVGPVGPVGPVEPDGPLAPVMPVGPRVPVGPRDPVGPRASVGPVAPVAPLCFQLIRCGQGRNRASSGVSLPGSTR